MRSETNEQLIIELTRRYNEQMIELTRRYDELQRRKETLFKTSTLELVLTDDDFVSWYDEITEILTERAAVFAALDQKLLSRTVEELGVRHALAARERRAVVARERRAVVARLAKTPRRTR